MSDLRRIADFQDQFFRSVQEVGGSLLTGSIKDELKSSRDFPAFLKADFGILINQIGPLAAAQNLFDGIWTGLTNDLKHLFQSKDYDEFVRNLGELTKVSRLAEVPGILQGIIHMEVGVALSFITVLRNIPAIKLTNYEDDICQYFFSKGGYVTVSGNSIVPPKLPKSNAATGIKDFIKGIDGESYLRDLTRIIAETTGDKLYDLKRRFGNFKEHYEKADSTKKLVDWFDSFGDLAEASVLPVIESALRGIAHIQLNPLMAAAVATFCSVTVRKATEHSYLVLVEQDM